MGYMTTIVILNDSVDGILKDKKFPENLYYAILDAHSGRQKDVPIQNHVNACQVIVQHHADETKILAVGGNTGYVIGWGHWSNSTHRHLRQLAHQHGFKLVRDSSIKQPMAARSHREPCKDCLENAPYGRCLDCGAVLNAEYRCPKDVRHRT